jgi:tRNA (uracil-5-)-methyltransferase TRM9
MDKVTIQTLNQINRDFYNTVADDFDSTRQQAWSGWETLLPYLKTPLSVLDVGCGNGRFGLFLAQHLTGPIQYHGIDNNSALLQHAHVALADLDAEFETRDIIDHPPDKGSYDLVAVFGVLHHVPGAEQRLELMHTLAQRVAPGGLLAFACWRFYEYERFRQRIVPWPADLAADPNDFLLDWRHGANAIRYCHYVDDTEHRALIQATGLKEVVSYRADGFTGDVNCYSLLQLNKD